LYATILPIYLRLGRDMRLVTWTDDSTGYHHRSLVRNADPDDCAPEIGIPSDPPDLDLLDWTTVATRFPDLNLVEFKRKLHNRLIQTGLITWKDVQRLPNGLTRAVMFAGRNRELLAVIKRPLVALYRQ